MTDTESMKQTKSPLQRWREEAGFTQTECAALTGYSTAMWSRGERGERVFSPRAKVLIARRLGVSVAEIFPVEAAEPEPIAAAGT